jgi:hypothetical protein
MMIEILIGVFLISDAIYAIALSLIFDGVGPMLLRIAINVPFLVVGAGYLSLLHIRRNKVSLNSLNPDGFTGAEASKGISLMLSVFWILAVSYFDGTSSLESFSSSSTLIGAILRELNWATGISWFHYIAKFIYLCFVVASVVLYYKCYMVESWPGVRTGIAFTAAWSLWIVANMAILPKGGLKDFYWLLPFGDLFRLLCYGLISIYVTVQFVGPMQLREKHKRLSYVLEQNVDENN